MKKSVKALLMIICELISIIIGGFALVHLWEWFIAIPFHIQLITFWQALGINTITSYLTTGLKPKSGKETTEICIDLVAIPLFYWLLGFIFHLFM